MRKRYLLTLFLLILVRCNNYGLLDKLQNSGSVAAATPRKVFVTSATTPGSMSAFITIPGCTGLGNGLPPADCACRILASNAGIANSQNFVAWLSDNVNDARCRLMGSGGNTCAGASGGPWYNMKGDLVARDFGSLTSGGLSAPVLYTETGGTPTLPSSILTGTDTTGRNTTGNCANWTSPSSGGTEHYGNSTVTSAFWTQGTIGSGCTNGHVYCFEAK